MFYKHKKEDEKLLPSGVVRTVKGYTDDLMVCELKWDKGMFGEPHSHRHVQCGYIVKGSFEATVDGEKSILHAGDCFYAESNVIHSLLCLENGSVMLDIFTPAREDFM